MGMDTMTTMGALGIVIACLAGVAALTLFWRIVSHRPARTRPHLEGRRAAAYYYSPTGLQDERGLPTSEAPTRSETVAKD